MMLDRHMLPSSLTDDVPVERLLEPSRITMNYKLNLKDQGLNSYMSTDIKVEPLELKIGFRELDFFNQLNK